MDQYRGHAVLTFDRPARPGNGGLVLERADYHAHVGSVRFPGQGWVRPAYFALLISHTFLAAAAVPLVLLALTAALQGRFGCHRRIARWAYPIWLYVSVTGVVVYVLLYRI